MLVGVGWRDRGGRGGIDPGYDLIEKTVVKVRHAIVFSSPGRVKKHLVMPRVRRSVRGTPSLGDSHGTSAQRVPTTRP